ncbi:uncharacterized protein N7477_004517 [Penicillium maclennaniae]|uniref:uncharacterized protein n=1 Tax=Penicillium maclennaniae TaxID=1343394 RepID=UPI002541DC0A|nr:uncharacterized protein N7477_004517 [Penicillium maclennaniae]KAJ5674583.1 hypothetical protein N7477_004517 [Penicillium maclennaniae]
MKDFLGALEKISQLTRSWKDEQGSPGPVNADRETITEIGESLDEPGSRCGRITVESINNGGIEWTWSGHGLVKVLLSGATVGAFA